MKAVVMTEYGGPEVLRIAERPQPEPGARDLLIKTRAAGVNFGDLIARNFRAVSAREFHMLGLFWLLAKLAFGLRRPRIAVLGNEFSGVVEAVGPEVTAFKPGDAVFGYLGEAMGAYAEYIRVPEQGAVALMPARLSFEQAAVIPYGAIMAYSLLSRAGIRPGAQVLINGASGGIGSAAVQIAKHLGAEVTGVCGGPRLDYVRALGADHVIDYAREDFTRGNRTYDLVLDVLGRCPFARCQQVLNPGGRQLCASFKSRHLVRMFWTAWFGSRKLICAIAPGSAADLRAVRTLIEAGRLTEILDRTYPMDQAAQAHARAESGQAQGKIAIVFC